MFAPEGAPESSALVVIAEEDLFVLSSGAADAVARIAGETAPLLFTSLSNQFWSADMNAPMANLPVVIFRFALSPYRDWQDLAWAGALLITVTILIINITARLLAGLGSKGR